MAAGGEKRAASSMTGCPRPRGLAAPRERRPSCRAVESSQLRRPALFRSKDVARRMPSDDPPRLRRRCSTTRRPSPPRARSAAASRRTPTATPCRLRCRRRWRRRRRSSWCRTRRRRRHLAAVRLAARLARACAHTQCRVPPPGVARYASASCAGTLVRLRRPKEKDRPRRPRGVERTGLVAPSAAWARGSAAAVSDGRTAAASGGVGWTCSHSCVEFESASKSDAPSHARAPSRQRV